MNIASSQATQIHDPTILRLLEPYSKQLSADERAAHLGYACCLYRVSKRARKDGRSRTVDLFIAKVIGDYLNEIKAAHRNTGGYAARVQELQISEANALDYRAIAEQWSTFSREDLVSLSYEAILAKAKQQSALTKALRGKFATYSGMRSQSKTGPALDPNLELLMVQFFQEQLDVALAEQAGRKAPL